MYLSSNHGFLIAQSERGTIRGTVTDSSGSVMPGVTVKAVNVDTGIETADCDHGFWLIQHPPAASRVITLLRLSELVSRS